MGVTSGGERADPGSAPISEWGKYNLEAQKQTRRRQLALAHTGSAREEAGGMRAVPVPP